VTRKHFAALALVPAALVVAVAMVLPAGAADAPGPAGPASWGAKLSCTANSAGYCTVAHPAGVVPDAVVVTPATAAMTSVDQLTAATFRVRFYRAIAATGAVAGLPGPHTFYVHVDWTAGVPSPQPSASNTGGPSSSPSAGPSPSGPASPSPSAQPSLSPSASPSAPPAPSPSPTDPAGWPGPDNTGVPAGVTLTAYAGPCTITAANTVIDAADVACDLDIRAPGVTISRSRIHGEINGGEGTGSSFLVEDSEVVNGKRAACQCVGSDHFTMLRVEVTGGNRGVYCRLDCTVRDSWIHGTDLLATQHASAVRVEQHSTVVHNTLQCDWTAITDSEIGCSADPDGLPGLRADPRQHHQRQPVQSQPRRARILRLRRRHRRQAVLVRPGQRHQHRVHRQRVRARPQPPVRPVGADHRLRHRPARQRLDRQHLGHRRARRRRLSRRVRHSHPRSSS
jgi:hypothetical protein